MRSTATQLTADRKMYVVSEDSITNLTFKGLTDALVGGMVLNDVAIFFDEDEAVEHLKRNKLVAKVVRLLVERKTDELEGFVDSLESVSLLQAYSER